ncbi:MAG: PIN domain-containing protein, partial [Deltaproteobacteria bacterium]|nr:PIN domain-containing protein [Deltaproteobacteria bacterium]
MKGVLVDSNVILDIFLNDPHWAEWSEAILGEYSVSSTLHINPIIYSEVSIGFERIEDLESAMNKGGFQMLELPKEALFLAGKAFLKYRRTKG